MYSLVSVAKYQKCGVFSHKRRLDYFKEVLYFSEDKYLTYSPAML